MHSGSTGPALKIVDTLRFLEARAATYYLHRLLSLIRLLLNNHISVAAKFVFLSYRRKRVAGVMAINFSGICRCTSFLLGSA
jgi:hypothetical protein